ncbi:DUF4376 domain-containing protein [Undibacterium sp. Rencai35W]|uniref:DUF4376 domain-containing protein n=1 Tax=Undibacterium sp. Rencai35W TaxID=3413046 RepID=UPI003BF1B2A5
MNTAFYYLCDLDKKVAIDYRQIPEVFGNITGMADLNDASLASLAWAKVPSLGFLKEPAALAAGISVASMTAAYNLGAEARRTFGKDVRETNVENIKVTTAAGNTFDGDEVSQNRMARAIVALTGTNTPSTLWVLANNNKINVTAAELTEALALAGAAQAAMWVIP